MPKRLLHHAVHLFQAVRRQVWFVTQPETSGVHGIALTREGKVVLVKLSYAPGWRLPGGGHRANEEPQAAMLRELREEIGLRIHGSIELVTGFRHRPDFRRGRGSLFIIRDVSYKPRRWSLEVTEVAEFDLRALPVDTARITHRLLRLAQPQLDLPVASATSDVQ